MKRTLEFFQADEGMLSMTRLLCFISIFPASYVLLTNPSEGMLGFYLGAYVGGYLGGKGADVMRGRKDAHGI
jgi:hypothetical protein